VHLSIIQNREEARQESVFRLWQIDMAASREYETFYRGALSKKFPVDLPIEEIRAYHATMMKEYPPAPEVRFEPFSIGELPGVWAFAPEVNRRKIILFFMGGGFTAGSIESQKNFIGRLSAAAGAAICAIQYRLAPENPYPAALDDALTAYRWLLHHPYARSKILFSGISAGGGLALSLFLRLKLQKIAMPAGALLFCPWVDLRLSGESYRSNKGKDLLSSEMLSWCAEKYASGKDLADPFLSPLYGDLEGLPPLFIQTGARELLHAEALKLAENGQKQGVSVTLDVWVDMVHAWQLFAPQYPEAQEAIERAGQFVDQLFKKQ
jgi:monoterpene epsilon-lactone hydrolase